MALAALAAQVRPVPEARWTKPEPAR